MGSSPGEEANEGNLAFQRADFFAEDELIEISPMVKSGVISLVRGDFGPFEPQVTTTVRSYLTILLAGSANCFAVY